MDEKICRKCERVRPLDEFYRDTNARDGRRPECIPCARALRRAWYQRNREKAIADVKRWQAENRGRHLETQRVRRQRPEVKQRDRAGHLKRKYGMTLGQYDALLAAQGGGCAICHRPPNDVISLHVDHEHSSGRVRALLCVRCNNGLGLFDEDPALFAAAVTYLTARVASPDL